MWTGASPWGRWWPSPARSRVHRLLHHHAHRRRRARARPHESADPIVGLAALVSALQTIISRRLDPAQPGVVTVGMVNAGTAPNIIPESATLRGTVRATSTAARDLLVGEVDRLTFSIANAYRMQAAVEWGDRTPPVVSSPDGAAWALEAATHVLGVDAIVPFGTTNMGGEDFAFYLEKFPGCFMRIGAREPGGDFTAPTRRASMRPRRRCSSGRPCSRSAHASPAGLAESLRPATYLERFAFTSVDCSRSARNIASAAAPKSRSPMIASSS